METAQKEKITTQRLYQEIYKGCKMGAESIVNLLPKVNDDALRSELTAQLERYEEFSSRARGELFDMDKSPKEESAVTRLSAKLGVMMNTMINIKAIWLKLNPKQIFDVTIRLIQLIDKWDKVF